MKNILVIMLMTALSLNSYARRDERKIGIVNLSEAQFNSYVTSTPEGIEVDIAAICAETGECSNDKGVKISYEDLFSIKITLPYVYESKKREDQFKVTNLGLTLCQIEVNEYYDLKGCMHDELNFVKYVSIVSNLSIVNFTSSQELQHVSNRRNFVLEDVSLRRPKTYRHDANFNKSITLYTENEGHGVTLKTLTLSSGAKFKNFYEHAKTPMRNALKNIKKETLNFQRHMSKSDRNLDHFERFIVSLDDALSIIEDKKNFSILDWRIQEGMRRVVAFGMIISDLLWAYEDVPGAAKSIKNIRDFRKEVRSSYGWENTLAGNVSKTTSALLELVHYEISEILKVKITTGENESFATYSLLTNRIRNLVVKINSSDGGDIQAGQHIGPLMETWNSPEWQQELKRLMEAKLDIRKLVRPKLKYILNAMLALEELIDNRRIYFEIETIKAAAGERPSRG
ncbi:MAG: hypothetical protein CME69_01300 [Halobacteriovorax sp.]|nr:hypothetical protein [Halobacteriovorax sp.]